MAARGDTEAPSANQKPGELTLTNQRRHKGSTGYCGVLSFVRDEKKLKFFFTLSTKYFYNDMQFKAKIARVEKSYTGFVFLSLKSSQLDLAFNNVKPKVFCP